MPLVAASGAATFRIPQGAINESLVEAAAQNHVTILAQLGGGSTLPSNRAAFREEVAARVRRYGVNGSFWSGHPSLPAEPITTWEVWNEENDKGIAAAGFGEFVSEIADAVHSASLGGSPEVLFGGLLVWGNSPHGETGADSYLGAQQYLEAAYPHFGGDPNVTGVAIHPYELEPETFHQPGYTAVQAFEYAVSGLRTKLNQLASANKTPQKQLSITEFGWPAAGGQWNVGESQQAALLGQAVNYARSNAGSLGLTNLDWYNYRDATGEEHEWARYCGLRAFDEHFRPAWTEFQAKAGVRQWIPRAPVVETSAATEVRASQATLNGSVNPGGLPTTYRFEYGTTASYGNSSPAGSAGQGEGVVAVSTTAATLQPGTTYHYRIVATNAVSTSYGGDQVFATTHEYPRASFADVVNSNAMTTWSYQNASRWSQLPFFGDEIAKGTHPSAILINNQPHVFFVDASKSNTISDWNWNPTTGWQLTPLYGDHAAPGSSPSAAILNGTPHVFFNDATDGETMTAWTWNTSTGWSQMFLYGHKLAEHTSPSVAMLNGTPHAFFVDATAKNTLTAWNWTPSLSWNELRLGGDQVAAGTSPSVAMLNGIPHAFFVDATRGNTLTAWNWTPSLSWNELRLGGDQVAAGTSPSAVQVGETPHVFFDDATRGNTLTAWNWTPSLSWNELRLGGDKISTGTSPSAIVAEGQPHVFFVDSAQGNTLTDWNWNSSQGWHETRLGGHSVTPGTSPGAWVSE